MKESSQDVLEVNWTVPVSVQWSNTLVSAAAQEHILS